MEIVKQNLKECNVHNLKKNGKINTQIKNRKLKNTKINSTKIKRIKSKEGFAHGYCKDASSRCRP